MDFISLEILVPLVVVVLGAWYALDMRWILKFIQRDNQLSIEGRWDDLEQHFKLASKTYRPFAWFHRKYLLPGTVAAKYAFFLFNRGRLEEALAKADQAIAEIERKPRIFSGVYRSGTIKILWGALNARCLILAGLGQYGEAREVAARVQQLNGGRPVGALATLEYRCGHLDEAIAQAIAARPADPDFEAMRGVMALAYTMKGEFDQGIQALQFEPGDISKFYSAAGLAVMRNNPEGPKLIELQRRKVAGILQPGRLLQLAMVYLSEERFEDAARVLDQAEKLLGPEPAGQLYYCRHRACSLAGQGKANECESYIDRMRAIAQQLPKRAFLQDTHYSTGKAYFYLGRFREALAEFAEAQRLVLHPVEKHATAYWIARTHEAAGNRQEAISHYQVVAADTIPSFMRKRAADALSSAGASERDRGAIPGD